MDKLAYFVRGEVIKVKRIRKKSFIKYITK